MHGRRQWLGWCETQLLITDNPSDKVKSEEVVSAKHLLHGSNRACLKTNTNCPNYESCNRYRQNAPDDKGKNKRREKNSQGKENASSLPFSSTVSPYSLWMVRNGFSIHFTSVVQQFTHCSRFRNSSTWSHVTHVHPVAHYFGFQTVFFREPDFKLYYSHYIQCYW